EPNIGHWNSAKDVVSWKVEVDRPGKFDVSLLYSMAADRAGATFNFSAGDQVLHGTVEATRNANTYKEMKLGTIELRQSGLTTFTITPEKVPEGGSVMNLRSVTLTPVH